MNREQKTAVVDEIAEQIGSAEAVFAVDYRGISVAQAASLRDRLREADARFRVVKNSLSERAADKAGLEDLKPMLVGPTALTLVSGDAAVAAQARCDLARQFNRLEFKGGLLNGAPLSAEEVRSIARLPAREVLHSQLVGTVAAPLSGLVRGLNALIAGLAIQLQAIADQGLINGEAPAGEAPAAAEEAPAAEAVPAAEEEAPAAAGEAPAAEAVPAAAEEEAPAAAEEAPAVEEAPAAAEEAASTTESETETATEAASDAEPSDDKEEA
jgi:large subunit ribosomal protein L10